MNVKNIKFKRVTILLPVIDEYKSLTKQFKRNKTNNNNFR